MENQKEHKYWVVGSKYVGDERFVPVHTLVVANSPEEANDIVFRELIIPRIIKDAGIEEHKYLVSGSKYIGNEKFRRIDKVFVAHSPEEANYLAFQKQIIPTAVKDLGTAVEQAMRVK